MPVSTARGLKFSFYARGKEIKTLRKNWGGGTGKEGGKSDELSVPQEEKKKARRKAGGTDAENRITFTWIRSNSSLKK